MGCDRQSLVCIASPYNFFDEANGAFFFLSIVAAAGSHRYYLSPIENENVAQTFLSVCDVFQYTDRNVCATLLTIARSEVQYRYYRRYIRDSDSR